MLTRVLSAAVVTVILLGFWWLFIWKGAFDPTTTEQAKRDFSEGERHALALAMWHFSSRGSGTKLEKQLIGIAFLNEERSAGGRDLETLFQRAIPMLPPSERDSKTRYYSTRLVTGETYVFGRTSFNQTVILADELIKARDNLTQVLPEERQQLVCVVRLVRAQGGLFTKRRNKSLDQMAKEMESEGLKRVYTSQDGARFFCPK